MKELFAALAKARASIVGVGRDGRNSQQGYNYASAEAMMAVASPALADNGLSVFPNKYRPDFDAMLLHVEYVLAHASGESMPIESTTPMVITKFKSGAETPPDKALGAAKTYDLRYMLRGLLNIPQVEKDADVDQREGEHRPQPRRQSPAQRQEAVSQRETEASVADQAIEREEAQKTKLKEELGAFRLLMGVEAYRVVLGGKPPADTVEALQDALAKCQKAHAMRTDHAIYNSKETGREPGQPENDNPPSADPPEPAPSLRVVPPEEKATNAQPPAKEDARKEASRPRNGKSTATQTAAPAQAGQASREVSAAELSRLIASRKFNLKQLDASMVACFGDSRDLHLLNAADRLKFAAHIEAEIKARVLDGLGEGSPVAS